MWRGRRASDGHGLPRRPLLYTPHQLNEANQNSSDRKINHGKSQQ